ncbi:unnamed protein product [Paramecium octaurelia]|uniref:Uncharacterized protein n=1 Tax=Paramecium octaurelia TaxID=43137 RepID=A0A8S1UCJ1_PAROT|nr:unnamed protein product [Paramecium octaurelia]
MEDVQNAYWNERLNNFYQFKVQFNWYFSIILKENLKLPMLCSSQLLDIGISI